MRVALVAAAAGMLALAGCSAGSGITTGTVPGANTGRLIGSPLATGSGDPDVRAVEGGMTGVDVGRSLNAAARAAGQKAEYEALEYGHAGRPTEWKSPEGDFNGVITVGNVYRVNRLDCRHYTHRVLIGGRTRLIDGSACRQPDGVWRILR